MHWAIVPSAGEGTRAATNIPKQYIKINGTCVVEYSIQALLECEKINKVIVALSPSDQYWEATKVAAHPKVRSCLGAKYRFESVANALKTLSDMAADDDWVIVHDAVRPCLLTQDLIKMLKEIETEPAGGIAVMPVSDTIKTVEGDYINKTLKREELLRAATPQIFRYGVLCTAMEYVKKNNIVPSDEATAVSHIGKPIKAIVCDHTNIKLTYPSDKTVIESLLALREK